MKKLIFFFSFVVFIIVVDQASKIYVHDNLTLYQEYPVIDGLFNIKYVRNSGAAFGFGGDFSNWIRYTLFLFVPVVACFYLIYALVKSISGPMIMTWAYALILGGAIGNLIDRFWRDYVVDMFDFYYKSHHFATFNVADSAISLAAILIVIDYLVNHKKEKEKAEAEVTS